MSLFDYIHEFDSSSEFIKRHVAPRFIARVVSSDDDDWEDGLLDGLSVSIDEDTDLREFVWLDGDAVSTDQIVAMIPEIRDFLYRSYERINDEDQPESPEDAYKKN